ncbi:2625_t:CDS:2, partial [Scutellospora calospora]
SILVLKSTLQQCRKNIITDFISDKVLESNLYYATSDLGKILRKFNSIIQEGKDTLLKIETDDAHIVCFDVSVCCRGNIAYFNRLGEILDYSDAPGVVMSYLLSCDLLKWNIPIFDVSEIVTSKLEKIEPISLLTNHIGKDQDEFSIASSSKSTDISLSLEIMNVESLDDKSKSSEIIEESKIQGHTSSVNDKPEISPDLLANNKPKSSNKEVNIQLESYPPEFLKNLTDDKKQNQACRCLRDGFKFSSEQVGVLIPNQRSGKNKTINLVEGNCRIAITKLPKSLEEEIIKEKAKRILQNRYRFSEDQVNALFTIPKTKVDIVQLPQIKPQQILQDKLSIRDIRAEAYALALSAKNVNADLLRLTHLCRELRNLNALLEIIESVNRKKAEAKRIDYLDEFTLELVKERLDVYDIKTLPDCQALADIIVIFCIRPAELKTFCAISSRRMGNPGKPEVKWFNKFLKDYDLIPKYLRKFGAVYSTVAHKAKNMTHAYTIARECLYHSSDNHTSSVQNYIVVNYRKRGILYKQVRRFHIYD